MDTTATGRPPPSSTARRITFVGMDSPTVAMRTAEDCDGCLSHLPLPNRDLAGLEVGSSTALSVRVPISTSACVGGGARGLADAGRLHVDGIHVLGIQQVGLLHVVEVDTAWRTHHDGQRAQRLEAVTPVGHPAPEVQRHVSGHDHEAEQIKRVPLTRTDDDVRRIPATGEVDVGEAKPHSQGDPTEEAGQTERADLVLAELTDEEIAAERSDDGDEVPDVGEDVDPDR